MNLHALRLFDTVARLGSVTKASEHLRISQPAVTMQLRNLERETGLTLLISKGRGVILTDAGRMLAEHAERLFAMEREIEDRVSLYREGRRGKLRLSVTSLPAYRLLPQWTADYKLGSPDIEINIYSCNRREAVQRLLTYQADLAIIGGGGIIPDQLEHELLLQDDMCFVVPRNHPLANRKATLESILQEPFIVREEGSSAREKLEGLSREKGLPLKIGLTVNGLYEIIRAVAAGYGAMFVSALEVKQAVEEGEVCIVDVREVQLHNPIHLCWRAKERLTPAAELFRDLVYESIRTLPVQAPHK
ncbi:MAG: transcriptional regulator [Paenibacillus sp.]|nr:transcriptional regulator [Paenibacillus sp.]